jgi:hypothetical protein
MFRTKKISKKNMEQKFETQFLKMFIKETFRKKVGQKLFKIFVNKIMIFLTIYVEKFDKRFGELF